MIPSLQSGIALTITMGTDPGEVDGTVQAGSVEAGVPVNIVTVLEGRIRAGWQDMERTGVGFRLIQFQHPESAAGRL